METILTTDITVLEADNIYIVDSILDFNNKSITVSGDCSIVIKQDGCICNSTIDNNSNNSVNIYIESNNIAFKKVQFIGDFIQSNDITVLSTRLLSNYTLPIGFIIKTLCYEEQGDLGGSLFNVISFSDFNHRLFLYPFDPQDDTSPVIVYMQKDKYFAEELGIFKTDVSDNSLAVNNRKQFERHSGRSFIIKFGLGYYYINNINVDNFVDYKGDMSNYYSVNIEGSTNDFSEDNGKTFIITDRSNFIYSVQRNHFKCSIKYCNIETIGGNHFTDEERVQKRMGYGFTRFDKDPLIYEDAKPSNTCELTINLQNVSLYGFWAGFYSGQWSTGCILKNTNFNGCRYGFYSDLASNLSLFEGIGIYNCAFGLTVGGDKCVIRRVEIEDENWYRDEDALSTDYFYAYRSNNGYHACYIEDVYLEDYMGDAESRKKYIIFSLSALSQVVFNRIVFQNVSSDTAAYHMEIFRPKGYDYLNLQVNRSIAEFKDGDLPVKVKTSEDWVITGISHNGSIISTSKTYKVGEEDKTVCFFSGRGVLHFWSGKPISSWNTDKLLLYFNPEQYKYYNQLIYPNEKKPVLINPQLIRANGYFKSPAINRKYNLIVKINGKCKINMPFFLCIGDYIKLIIFPYKIGNDIYFNYNYNAIVEMSDITSSADSFPVYLKGSDVDSDFMPNNNNLLKFIEIENFDFSLYE